MRGSAGAKRTSGTPRRLGQKVAEVRRARATRRRATDCSLGPMIGCGHLVGEECRHLAVWRQEVERRADSAVADKEINGVIYNQGDGGVGGERHPPPRMESDACESVPRSGSAMARRRTPRSTPCTVYVRSCVRVVVQKSVMSQYCACATPAPGSQTLVHRSKSGPRRPLPGLAAVMLFDQIACLSPQRLFLPVRAESRKWHSNGDERPSSSSSSCVSADVLLLPTASLPWCRCLCRNVVFIRDRRHSCTQSSSSIVGQRSFDLSTGFLSALSLLVHCQVNVDHSARALHNPLPDPPS